MLGIVIVNYNSEKETVNYINAELSKITSLHKIVIVNNSSSIESNKFFIKELRALPVEKSIINTQFDIFLLSPDSNLGFAKGNNLGATFLTDHFNIEYLLFTNSDIVLSDKDVVESLISKAGTDDKIGGIGPRIVGDNGIDQSPIMFIPAIKYLAKYLIKPLINKIYKNSHHTSSNNNLNKNQEGFYYTVSGCFMLVKAAVFLSAEKFDPETFLYSEERILSERFNKTGNKFYYYPEVSILHYENTTTLRSFKIPELRSFLFDSEYYYYTKYIISNPLVLLIFKLIKYYRKFKKAIR